MNDLSLEEIVKLLLNDNLRIGIKKDCLYGLNHCVNPDEEFLEIANTAFFKKSSMNYAISHIKVLCDLVTYEILLSDQLHTDDIWEDHHYLNGLLISQAHYERHS